jgi:hypothetical protein
MDEKPRRQTNRNDVADQLVGDQHHVFPGDTRIELALAVLPFPELVRQFPEPQRPAATASTMAI